MLFLLEFYEKWIIRKEGVNYSRFCCFPWINLCWADVGPELMMLMPIKWSVWPFSSLTDTWKRTVADYGAHRLLNTPLAGGAGWSASQASRTQAGQMLMCPKPQHSTSCKDTHWRRLGVPASTGRLLVWVLSGSERFSSSMLAGFLLGLHYLEVRQALPRRPYCLQSWDTLLLSSERYLTGSILRDQTWNHASQRAK